MYLCFGDCDEANESLPLYRRFGCDRNVISISSTAVPQCSERVSHQVEFETTDEYVECHAHKTLSHWWISVIKYIASLVTLPIR